MSNIVSRTILAVKEFQRWRASSTKNPKEQAFFWESMNHATSDLGFELINSEIHKTLPEFKAPKASKPRKPAAKAISAKRTGKKAA